MTARTTNAANWRIASVNIDRVRQAHYIGRMTKKTDQPNIEQELELLEDRVGSLLDIVERLMKETAHCVPSRNPSQQNVPGCWKNTIRCAAGLTPSSHA